MWSFICKIALGIWQQGTSQPTALPHFLPDPHTRQTLWKGKGLSKDVVWPMPEKVRQEGRLECWSGQAISIE